MTFKPTPQQAEIISAVKEGRSIMISALAGAAKTSTIELATKAMDPAKFPRAVALAFNKKIQLELQERLPFKVLTMNGLGFSALTSAIRGVKIEAKKMALLRKDKFPDEAWETARLASKAKLTGIVPKGLGIGKTLVPDEDHVWQDLADEDDLPYSMIPPARALLRLSVEQAIKGLCDFDDQVYMPVCFGYAFRSFETVFVDEAQDLSPLNHEMIRRLKASQLVVVGDPLQSIYAFRGASHGSMEKLREDYNLEVLKLTTSFRCPKAVVREARAYAPDMEWPEWAIEGEVRHVPSGKEFREAQDAGLSEPRWDFSRFSGPVTVLCRNNAPLVRMGLKIARLTPVGFINGRLKDTLLGKLREICRWKKPDVEVLLEKLQEWKEKEMLVQDSSKHGRILDLADSLEAACEGAKTYADVEQSIAELFQAANPRVLFGTGHSAKGLEWDDVLFLDEWLLPSKYATSDGALQQEKNLAYVITTRAKKRLTHADSRNFRWYAPLGKKG